MCLDIVNKDMQKRVINHYGADAQLNVCMEEPAELIQAISKMRRGIDNLDNLKEEIADTLICVSQLIQIYNIEKADIKKWIDYKQERAIKRINEDKVQQNN